MHMEEHICPVCGMDAKDSTVHAEHIGIEYYFCSPQCRENFIVRPQLYLGRQSVKKNGREIIKRRSLSLDQAVEGALQEQLVHAIKKMMGVRDVQVNGREVSITYDMLEVTAEQIERSLGNAGAVLGTGWGARLQRGWAHYTEENELDNLASGKAACCNKPPALG